MKIVNERACRYCGKTYPFTTRWFRQSKTGTKKLIATCRNCDPEGLPIVLSGDAELAAIPLHAICRTLALRQEKLRSNN
jgi:hypothetical protein